jgi:hypothetical protein
MLFLIVFFLSTGHSYASRGEEAMRLIPWNWQKDLPEWTVRFGPGRGKYFAMTNFETNIIDVWVRDKQTKEEIAGSVVHELSHAFQRKYLTDETKRVWMEKRGIPDSVTWEPPCEKCTDYDYGTGDMAESFIWTLIGVYGGFDSRLGPPPNAEQQAMIRSWLSLK